MTRILPVIVFIFLMIAPVSIINNLMKPNGIELLEITTSNISIMIHSLIQIVGITLLTFLSIKQSRQKIINLNDIGSFNIMHAIAIMKDNNASMIKVESKFDGSDLFFAVFMCGENKIRMLKSLVSTISDIGINENDKIVSTSVDIAIFYGVERLISGKWSMIRRFESKEDALFFHINNNERLVEVISVPVVVESRG